MGLNTVPEEEDPDVLILGETGSVRGAECVMASCGHRGWMAPSSRRWLARTAGVRVLCFACGLRLLRLKRARAEFGTIPGQAEEFAEALAGWTGGAPAN